jgi:hypothetical protein
MRRKSFETYADPFYDEVDSVDFDEVLGPEEVYEDEFVADDLDLDELDYATSLLASELEDDVDSEAHRSWGAYKQPKSYPGSEGDKYDKHHEYGEANAGENGSPERARYNKMYREEIMGKNAGRRANIERAYLGANLKTFGGYPNEAEAYMVYLAGVQHYAEKKGLRFVRNDRFKPYVEGVNAERILTNIEARVWDEMYNLDDVSWGRLRLARQEHARFEEGVPADPTVNMSEEEAEEWRENTEKYKDKFKKARREHARFEEGVPADPTVNMTEEEAEEWRANTEKYQDKFKKASSDERVSVEEPSFRMFQDPREAREVYFAGIKYYAKKKGLTYHDGGIFDDPYVEGRNARRILDKIHAQVWDEMDDYSDVPWESDYRFAKFKKASRRTAAKYPAEVVKSLKGQNPDDKFLFDGDETTLGQIIADNWDDDYGAMEEIDEILAMKEGKSLTIYGATGTTFKLKRLEKSGKKASRTDSLARINQKIARLINGV